MPIIEPSLDNLSLFLGTIPTYFKHEITVFPRALPKTYFSIVCKLSKEERKAFTVTGEGFHNASSVSDCYDEVSTHKATPTGDNKYSQVFIVTSGHKSYCSNIPRENAFLISLLQYHPNDFKKFQKIFCLK